jgi:serine/threonine-protein kinase
MAIATSVDLLEILRAHRILESTQLDTVRRDLLPGYPDPRAFARELIQRRMLTAFQGNQLFRGKAAELVLGPYILLDRLGEGGMGEVYRARNSRTGRVVAVKLIRPERLNSGDAVRRFEREVRAAAQLDHPNVVHALDADHVGDKHMLVMELIDGIDLGRRVKQQGPLPWDTACEYIRQAALGLQHAHEQGMVHRDIKPSNLLVTSVPNGPPAGLVKILDMGLARITHGEGGSVSTLTKEGAVMGTPDYLAPEQAMGESHTADIRADLYSLGCTFYYLLAGRPPFPCTSIGEKLLKHQSQDPVPLEHLRPGLPPGVIAIVRKLMAKLPEDRFQTPAALAQVLESGLRTGIWPALPTPSTPVIVTPPIVTPPAAAVPMAVPVPAGAARGPVPLAVPVGQATPVPVNAAVQWQAVVNEATIPQVRAARQLRTALENRHFLLIVGIGAGILLAGLALMVLLILRG